MERKRTLTTYELYLVENGELLSDNLTWTKANELYKAYENFYGNGSVYISCKTEPKRNPICKSTAQEFKEAWIDYFGELQSMGNLL